MNVQFFPSTIYWRDWLFYMEYSWLLCEVVINCIYMIYSWVLDSVPVVCLFFISIPFCFDYYYFIITMTSEIVMPLALTFKNWCGYWASFMDLYFFYFYKIGIRTLIVIALSQYWALDNIDILKILIFPICKHIIIYLSSIF